MYLKIWVYVVLSKIKPLDRFLLTNKFNGYLAKLWISDDLLIENIKVIYLT